MEQPQKPEKYKETIREPSKVQDISDLREKWEEKGEGLNYRGEGWST